MQIIIPMAGAGQRFRDAGFTLPKPLIDVDGVPMIVRVVQDLPSADRIVFVVNGDHVRDNQIDEVLLDHFPGSAIVIAPGLTEGQACSVQLGIPQLDADDDVLVAACDNTHLFNEFAHAEWTRNPSVDALIWTYRREPRVLVNPHWYGWVAADADCRVSRVSVKKPLSTDLLNDHVVSGTFWFRSARLLNDTINGLIRSNTRVNNEFYMDSAMNVLTEAGRDVRAFEVDKYIGWGTPDDYKDYHLWSKYVRKHYSLHHA